MPLHPVTWPSWKGTLDRQLFSASDSMCRHQDQAMRFDEWMNSVARLNYGLGLNTTGSDDAANAPSQRLRRLYDDPSPVEVQLPVPPDHTLAHVHKPETLVDIPALEERYKRQVLEGCGLGAGIYDQIMGGGGSGGKSKAGGGSSNGTGANLLAAMHASGNETQTERYLNHIVHAKREWNKSFFHHMYAHCWYGLDLKEIDEQLEYFEEQVMATKTGKREFVALKTELRNELSLLSAKGIGGTPNNNGELSTTDTDVETDRETRVQELKVKKDLAKARAGTKRQRRYLKDDRDYWASMWQEIHRKRDCLAKLVFHPGTTEKTAQLLGILLQQIYPLGLVKPKVLEPFMKTVFGPQMVVEKNPQPPLTAAKELSPGEELAAQTTLETAQLQSETAVETTQLKGAQQVASKKAAAPPKKPKPKKPKKKKKPAPPSPVSSDSEDDDSDEEDEKTKKTNKKKRKRGTDEKDKNKRAEKRARK